MKILLKDPDKVDAVIAKIHDIYPIKGRDSFEKFCVPNIRTTITNGDPVILEVEFRYDGIRFVSDVCYYMLSDIPTDEQYLNDNNH